LRRLSTGCASLGANFRPLPLEDAGRIREVEFARKTVAKPLLGLAPVKAPFTAQDWVLQETQMFLINGPEL